ncbi:PAS-domain containing protein [Maritimibacter alkaliphilus]|uniref:PAS-domain containing protein n=1 Tax=Maritimibacter alkaliphilus TaxID=404236 RepID=UPI0021BDC57F|nr:PAS-domain containing protein [Maritimibacter alkaliphilus]
MQADPHAMMQAGLNLIAQAMSIYDDDLQLVTCNRPFREMFDLPPELARPGAPFEATIRFLVQRGEYGPVDDEDVAVRRRVEQALAFQPHYMERSRANGRTISVEGAPLPQGGWVTVYTDITHIKQHEGLLRARSEELSEQLLTRAEELAAANRKLQATNAALSEAKRELTEMEARIRLTTEMMPAHIAHVSADRVYTYSNRRLNAIMPGRPSNILGLHMADVLGTQAYQAVLPYVEIAQEGRASSFEFTDEASSRRIRTATTPDGDGGVYILSQDVTEETQTRNALQQTRRRELAAQMTSGMAHDFSNLLTIILGSQSRLLRMDLSEEAQPLVSATLSAAKRGGRLLDRIAAMTTGRDYTPAPCDPAALLRDLQTLATSALPDGLRFTLEDRLGPGRLMLDSGQVQDSLLNLILNARDACGGAGQITLTAARLKETWLEFTVTDTGPGFSPEALKRGLDPFYTTKGGEGSGLGLAMVYDMAKLAGGRVRLENTTSGARVTLRLPLREAPRPAEPGLALLVEDSPDLRDAIRDMLRAQGHAVIEAASTEEALTLATQVPGVTLILSDITLEGASTGLDLLDRLPANAPPCYLMTSLRPDHPLHRAAKSRAPVLRKPFTGADLGQFLATGQQP